MKYFEEGYITNRKRNLFFLFILSPVILWGLWSILSHFFFKPSKEVFNITSYTLLILELLFIFSMKKSVKLFDVKTHIWINENGINIQSDESFFFKRKHILISEREINYFEITEYQSLVFKNVDTFSFKLSYNNNSYCAYILMSETEKYFINQFIDYLKELSRSGVNEKFYFKPNWLSKKSIRKGLLVFILATLFFVLILLFTVEVKVRAFIPLLSLSIFMQLFSQAKDMEMIFDKVQNSNSPYV